MVEKFFSFFADNFPPWWAIAYGGPLGLIWAYLCLSFAGFLKLRKGLRTGYSRKTLHFLIFATVALVQWIGGTPFACLFGGMTSLVVLYAVLRGSGHPLYEAMARESDAPHQTYFIVAPYFATLIGGLGSNILPGDAAVIGYLVTGFGDAVGEPVGVRFGRHKYRVPSFRGVESKRSLEGSAAVLIACLVAIPLAVLLCPSLALSSRSILTIPLLAIACAVVEAISPHGWDNATMQVIPTFLAVRWL
ncbi:MAG: hypothetical protein O6952_03775 [Planctomycetota bacterium]|nr:hypothetical protein [Planctomycetota bacterium]